MPFEIPNVEVRGRTAKGLWVGGEWFEDEHDIYKDVFIPDSQIDDDSEIYMESSEGDEGTLTISDFLAKRRGWSEEDPSGYRIEDDEDHEEDSDFYPTSPAY